MSDPAGSDKNLLDRLNALKPSTVKLDNPSTFVPTLAVETTEPVSREDGLSDRLKSLRNQADSSLPATKEAKADPRNTRLPTHEVAQPQDSPAAAGTGIDSSAQPAIEISGPLVYQEEDGTDPFLDTDEQTLEELLADLGSDEQWLEEVADEVSRSKDEEHRRVTALLEELGKVSLQEQYNHTPHHQEDQDGGSDSDDDSDGERVKREAENVLSQAVDEMEWEKANMPQEKSSHQGPSTHETIAKGDDASTGTFELPVVPTELQDQPHEPDPNNTSVQDDDFEAKIASRMAALKGLGGNDQTLPSVPSSQVDELGLPVAPTFAPGDRPAKSVYKRYGYTDEDAKTWCTVCLEDGAIRCFGCDDDTYCARCWKEMHVGPSAGYDERGHRWESFIKR
ncbi:hypothetical protein SCAR479_13610 [Seiridium cardinale]|uniref:Uncharacterized protein n=1 Tax=Seiridium cardinale TaxID=138064 RepID=A0ABR2X7H3_9PEZI